MGRIFIVDEEDETEDIKQYIEERKSIRREAQWFDDMI